MSKRILVVGMARSGIAAAALLANQGAMVIINDARAEEKFAPGELDALRRPGVQWNLGEAAETLLDGVDQLVISPGIPIDHPCVREAKRRGIEVIAEIELAFRSMQGMLIAITGTNGKTTTTSLTGELFKNAGRQTHVVGNIGYPFTAVAGEMSPADVTVCEVSSFQLESTIDFHPHIAAILNLSEDHLNRHGSMDTYVALKAHLFELQGSEDSLVLNYDDERLREMAASAKGRILWFSSKTTPPYGAFLRDGQIVFGTEDALRPICPVDEVGIPGAHNLENAMAAVCIAMAAQLPPPVIRHTLRTFRGVEHRIEFVRMLDGVSFYNDSKGTNVDSTLKAIETMDRPTVIILGGYDKKVDIAPVCEALVDSKITDVVLIGETAALFEKSLEEVRFGAVHRAGYDFQRAIEMARALARPGGNVLLSPACASFDMFKDFEHRGEEFKRIVGALEAQTP